MSEYGDRLEFNAEGNATDSIGEQYRIINGTTVAKVQ
jgi:hypothetical protein